ncbi:MAG TPA: molybdopterin cofactor-binding domain-containing protein, partial [Xanthobacteraceae bacterium]|nr:molybdopterin cofactor-binding domain-containing protein [Xanthobacteraceae bacterium]
EAIAVDYDALPAVVESRAALAPDAPQLFDHIPGNLVFDWDNDMCDFAATDAAFARAARVVKLDLVNNRVVANSMEARNAIGDWDEATGRPVLYTATQGSHFVRDALAEAILKVPKEKVRVVTPTNVGGAFGMKAFVYPEQVAVVWAAGKLKRPVKWQSDRSEGFVSDNQGRDHITHAELALDAEGRFLGIRVEIIANLGAYLSPMGPFIPTRSSDLICGLYTAPAIGINVKGVCTNTVPVCAYRGAGRPEASYLIERLVDAAARDIGMSPDRIRRINLIPPSAIPYTSATKITFDSGEFEKVMDLCIEKSDWAGFAARRKTSEERGLLRGIGMATYTERCGGGLPEIASIEFKDERVELVMGNQEYGTGLYTAYKQLVSDRLGIDADRIDVIMGDTDRSPRGLTGGSRALPVAGSALHEASLKIIDKGRQIAAHLLETAAVDIEFGDGEFRVVGTDRRVDLFAVAAAARDPARLPPGMAPGLDTTQVQTPSANTFPNGCHIVEVEIDPKSGVVRVDRYTVVDDFGAVINPMMLEGQVHGGIVQGLGQALLERTVYDGESGQLVTGSFMDYAMPRASDLPYFSFSTHNVPCKANPLGVKGAGEAGAIGAPPAVINAIVDALHARAGVRHIDMPATPRRVWEALHQNGAL